MGVVVVMCLCVHAHTMLVWGREANCNKMLSAPAVPAPAQSRAYSFSITGVYVCCELAVSYTIHHTSSDLHHHAGMSRVPIPKHLLEKAHTPSVYKVYASLNVSLGTAAEPNAATPSTAGNAQLDR